MRPRTPTILLLAVAAALAPGCGGDDEGARLPRGTASELAAQLDSIQARFEFPGGAACDDITGGEDPNTTRVAGLIDSLPDDVDAGVRDALTQSFDRLFELVEQECTQEEAPPETDTQTTETEAPPETETTETETIPTETLPTDTGEQPPTDTEPLPPGQGGEPPGQGGEVPGEGEGGGGFGPEGDG